MFYNKSKKGDKFVGYGFINNNKINNDISISANPTITTHPASEYRTVTIECEVYL